MESLMTAPPSVVRRTITVDAPILRAFTVFTEGFGNWWPGIYTVSGAPDATVIIEPGAGGRWYERDGGGSETPWGRVEVWDPPHRVLLAWHIDAAWQYRPDLEQGKEIEVRFSPRGDTATRVELFHRGFADSLWLMRSESGPLHGDETDSPILRRYAEAVAAL